MSREQRPQFKTEGYSEEPIPQIHARGDIKVRVALVWLMGVVLSILCVGLVLLAAMQPDKWKDFALVISPIISGILFGVAGFVIGNRRSNDRS